MHLIPVEVAADKVVNLLLLDRMQVLELVQGPVGTDVQGMTRTSDFQNKHLLCNEP